MKAFVSKPVSGLKGVAQVPGDKSISHRALMFGAIAGGETSVTGLLQGEDVLRTAAALTAMGADITPPTDPGGIWRIKGIGEKSLRTPKENLYLGNSGTSARLLMGLVAGYPVAAVFTGDESLSRRPMGRVVKPLTQMGAKFEAEAGDKLPIRVTGSAALQPIHYRLPVASAQLKSAILLAGLHANGKTIVVEPQPTRDHTEKMLAFMGAQVASEMQEDGSCIITLEGRPQLAGRNIIVPADPSSAAFLVVAALITKESDITVRNVLINPRRTGLYDTLQEMGADIAFENRRSNGGEETADIRVRSGPLKGVIVPKGRVPSMIDEFPILAVAAAFAAGKTVMTDLAELRVKESDRLAAIAKGLTAAGVKVEMGEDSLTVHGSGGKAPQGGCTVETQLDHRIAMSFLVLGMATQQPVAIDDAETIATSFPDFAALMNSLGAQIGPKPL
ncbi:MAG: 3-phosphoshikimate 1-carboxyvinyltransferase [Alphaproteobacteria bacterium]|nr:3-phosphoshikimate 1-carboxyvinyltransferase [Alphaproteobacteria bacterium]